MYNVLYVTISYFKTYIKHTKYNFITLHISNKIMNTKMAQK